MEPAWPLAADNLQTAYSNFETRSDAVSADQLSAFYEPRKDPKHLNNLLAALRTRVSLSSFLHALYMGPSGCGKSMDLAWLAEAVTENSSLEDSLLIVQFGVGSVVGTHMVGFAELSVALVLELYATFDRLEPTLDESYLDKIEEWFFTKRQRTTSTKKSASGGLGMRLKVLRLEFSGAKSQTETVVAAYQNRLSELRGLVEDLLAEVERLTGKHVLFIVDDLEKINPLDAALGLFLNQARFFAGLPCHMVLTAPGALRLDPRFGPDVLKHFTEFRAVLGDPSCPPTDAAERARLVQLVHRRIQPELLASEALELAIEKTGGVVGHLVDVLQRSILHAIAEEKSQVHTNHVEETLKNVQQRWLHSLKDAHYRELVRVREGGADAHLEEPSLLHSLAVLEYPDSPIRFAVHPLVVPLVERWERANKNRAR